MACPNGVVSGAVIVAACEQARAFAQGPDAKTSFEAFVPAGVTDARGRGGDGVLRIAILAQAGMQRVWWAKRQPRREPQVAA